MDTQLFPVLTYGCHVWNMARPTTINLISQAYRREIRRRLDMNN